ncbi:MAG: hypothetical protein K6E21_04655 [Bacilli bacterium]|nr:hypothetical protein [Bacilli bacterium]
MKRKLIGLTALLLSLSATACLGNDDGNKGDTNKTDTDLSEAGYNSTNDEHYKVDEKGNRIGNREPHTFQEYEGDNNYKPVAPTCTAVGKAFKKCTVCGRVVSYNVPALDHTWGPTSDASKAATCTQAGFKECTICHKQEATDALGHDMKEATAPTQGSTDAAVKKFACSRCNEVQYEIDAKTGNFQLASGSSWKSGNNPDSGAVKLNGDGQSFSFTFNLPKGFTGKMYQRAFMDNYSSNSSKKAFYETDSTANIEVLVNSNKVDLSSQNTVTFEDLFKGEVDGSNSVVKDILLGDVTLGTANTISYKRVKTLNMTVSTFVFVGSENA